MHSRKTSGRQFKETHQDDCKTRKDSKYRITKQRPNIKPLQTMGATINTESKTEAPPYNGKQPKPRLGGWEGGA